MNNAVPPSEGDDTEDDVDLRTRLNQETAVVPWSELVRHFARGVVIAVSVDVDLIEAAVCVIEDDTTVMSQWIEQSQVTRATDDHARDWTQREPEFWCVVTHPWVLVQEKVTTARVTRH